MTPKEKAKYLVNKSMPLAHDWESDNKVVAVKIALLCVDEIQEHAQMIETEYNGYDNPYQYFLQVKQEINKL